MKKLIIIGLVAAFTFACTTPEINEDLAEYGTKKSESVNSEGSSKEHKLNDELDDTED